MDIGAQIEDHNGVVLGPVATLDAGIAALQEQRPDACIVNINLGPNKVYELADLLIDEDVPFVFASSEPRAAIPDRFNDVPLHTKPMKIVEAAAALMRDGAWHGQESKVLGCVVTGPTTGIVPSLCEQSPCQCPCCRMTTFCETISLTVLIGSCVILNGPCSRDAQIFDVMKLLGQHEVLEVLQPAPI